MRIIQLDGQRHHLRLRSGRVVAGRGPHHEPQACITTTSETLYALSQGQARMEDAMSEGQLEVSGDHDTALRALQVLVFFEPSDGKEASTHMMGNICCKYSWR
jgi:putative sterol carrier protein